MKSISNGWDNTKQAEMSYFHFGPTGQSENERKGKQETKIIKNKEANKQYI